MKVIGIGLNKTGTTSLGRALEILGYTKHFSWSREYTQLWKEQRSNDLLNVAKDFDNLEDFPWALMYQELDQRFDDTFFILTTRRTPQVWYQSQCKHYVREHREETVYINEVIYGYKDPRKHQDEYINKYLQHNLEVKEYFSNKSNFTELCFDNGDGWTELCGFLDKCDVPKVKFPFLNQSPPRNFLERLRNKLKRYNQ